MAYSFGDQLNFLSSLVGDSNTDTSSQWPLAQRKTEINHAEKQFAKDSMMLLENASSTISSMELAVPSGWFNTFAFYITVNTVKYRIDNDREVSPKDLERWNTYSGDVPYYYFWGFSDTRKIKLLGNSSNINGSTYDLYYFKQPTTALDDTTDVSIIPEEYRQASVYKAASNLLLQIGQFQKSTELIQFYDRLVNQARTEVGRWYTDYDQPRPDFNIIQSVETDMQGQGW